MAANSQTIDGWLATHAAHQPGKTALRCNGRSWTYAEFNDWVLRIASSLYHDLDLRRGDRIAFLGHNSAFEAALFFAAARLGLMIAPLNWRLAVEELKFIVANADAKTLLYGPEFEAEAAAAAKGMDVRLVLAEGDLVATEAQPTPAAALTDPYLIVYTSGTTGQPKGAVLTQEAVLWNALSSLHAHDMTAADHVLNVLPLFHVGGINIQTMPCFFVGGTVTLHPVFDPGAAMEALRTESVTTAVFVPTMMRALMDRPDWADSDFPALRMLNTGSTDVPVDILRAVNDRGVPMAQVYGATETGPIAAYQKAGEAARTVGSIGRPAANVRIRIVGAAGVDCEGGETGEIWVKGPNMFSHYWRDEAATAAALDDGWFKTGDMAWRGEDGLLWFVGRLKHVIISGGENIYPAEIERLLDKLPGLAEAAVVGRPDPRWGEVPVVVAAKAPDGPTAQEVLAACDGRIARFKRPKDVVFVEALPRNALGKVIVEETQRLAVGVAVAEDG